MEAEKNLSLHDRLRIGVKKYGVKSQFIDEFYSLCATLRYDEFDNFFKKWKIEKEETSDVLVKPKKKHTAIEFAKWVSNQRSLDNFWSMDFEQQEAIYESFITNHQS